jgi:hypothetical protein
MTPQDIALAAINRIYGYSLTLDQIDSALPIVKQNYVILQQQIEALVPSAVAQATAPLYDEIARIKDIIAAAAKAVAEEK